MDNEANVNPDDEMPDEFVAFLERAAAVTNRRQTIMDELEILSRHLHDPKGNPL